MQIDSLSEILRRYAQIVFGFIVLENAKTMLSIPNDIAGQFDNVLQQREVPEALRVHYKKRLHFSGFCRKYQPPEAKSEQIRLFIEKLR